MSLLQGRGHGWRTPEGTMGISKNTETPENRSGQLHDEAKSCGNQSAYIRLINRRYMMTPPLAIKFKSDINFLILTDKKKEAGIDIFP